MAGTEVRAHCWVSEYISPWDIYMHGVDRVLAEVLPEGKAQEIKNLQAEGKVVAMVACEAVKCAGCAHYWYAFVGCSGCERRKLEGDERRCKGEAPPV